MPETECQHRRRFDGLPQCMHCGAPLDETAPPTEAAPVVAATAETAPPPAPAPSETPDRLRSIAADMRAMAEYIEERATQLEKEHQPE